MKILWFTWKDLTHPEAGGAEVVNEELAKRLAADGHEVVFIVGGYKGCKPKATVNGYRIIRLGNRYSVYYKAWRHYRHNLRGWADLVIDEVNTIPFFAKFYVKERNIVFAHMLCRQIWFYELPKLIGWIGYLAEPLYLRLLSDRKVITISESTKADLMRHGFKSQNISIISMGLSTLKPLAQLPPLSHKTEKPTILSLGAMRPMKQTLHQIKAFEIAKQTIPNLQLEIAGDSSGTYGKKVLETIKHSPYAIDITYNGRVSQDEKAELMYVAHLTLQTSVKEGWGLTVTEAASQGTPAVVYNIDGLRDSVRDGETGLITKQNNPQHLAAAIVTLLNNTKRYAAIRKAAWQWSKTISFDTGYEQFKEIINV